MDFSYYSFVEKKKERAIETREVQEGFMGEMLFLPWS